MKQNVHMGRTSRWMNKAIIGLAVLMMSFAVSVNAQVTKSYIQISMEGMNQNGMFPSMSQARSGCWIAWDNNDNMVLSDGTMWRLVRRNWDGSLYYTFAGTTGQYPTMPGTQYTEALVSSDRTMVKIVYQFGMMGFTVPIVVTYGYIGEGQQPYYDYMNGN